MLIVRGHSATGAELSPMTTGLSPRCTRSSTSAISSQEPTPTTASASGISSRTCSPKSWERQPATTRCLSAPVFLNSAASSTVFIASCLASSMNAQVLTTMASASSISVVISCPASRRRKSICSAETWFFGQPRDIIPTFIYVFSISDK